MRYLDIIKATTDKNTECEKRELSELSDQTDEADGLNSLSSLNSHSPTITQDSTTWPPYMTRLHAEALAVGGEDLARRQIRCEIAFWRNAEAEGWRLLTATNDDMEA